MKRKTNAGGFCEIIKLRYIFPTARDKSQLYNRRIELSKTGTDSEISHLMLRIFTQICPQCNFLQSHITATTPPVCATLLPFILCSHRV